MNLPQNRERGAVAITVAIMLVLLLGMAALAVDIGMGFTERRQDQTSSDLGVMAGAVDAISGVNVMRDQALLYSRKNLVSTYSDAAWQTAWEQCVDTELATLNAGTWNFQALTAPAGWNPVNPASWCISFDPSGFLRVRVPNQNTPTTFGRVIGTTNITTNADAIARILPHGGGGIRPFGLGSTTAEGSHQCLSSGPGGNSQPPATARSVATSEPSRLASLATPPTRIHPNCTASPPGDVLAFNIAAGIDHFVTVDGDGVVGNEIRDNCFNPGVDTLNTDTGFPNNGAEEGLVSGPVIHGQTPLLQQGTNTKRNVVGFQLDDRPLWDFLVNGLGGWWGQPRRQRAGSMRQDHLHVWRDLRLGRRRHRRCGWLLGAHAEMSRRLCGGRIQHCHVPGRPRRHPSIRLPAPVLGVDARQWQQLAARPQIQSDLGPGSLVQEGQQLARVSTGRELRLHRQRLRPQADVRPDPPRLFPADGTERRPATLRWPRSLRGRTVPLGNA